MAILVSARCTRCNQAFEFSPATGRHLGFNELPRRCPRCLDTAQHRPEVTTSRELLYEATLIIDHLPGPWVAVPPTGRHDRPAHRIIMSGRQYGAAWQGRLDLWSTDTPPPAPGDLAHLSHMRVTKEVVAPRPGHRNEFASQEEADAATQAIDTWRDASPFRQPRGWEPKVVPFTETRDYVRLDRLSDDATEPRDELPRLVYVTAYRKTTLKGLGRQFDAWLTGAPLWRAEVTGGVRSGRLSTTAWLAVIDPDHPITHHHREAYQETETRYPAA